MRAIRAISDLPPVRRLPARILDVGHGLLATTFGLLDLSFEFLTPVAGQLAEAFLDLTLGLVGSAFGVQIGHFETPASWLLKSSMDAHAVVRA
jgi:hypothetical protein